MLSVPLSVVFSEAFGSTITPVPLVELPSMLVEPLPLVLIEPLMSAPLPLVELPEMLSVPLSVVFSEAFGSTITPVPFVELPSMLATLIDGHRVAVLRDRRLTGRDLAARRQCLREAHAGLHRQDGDREGRHRRDNANDAACRRYLSRRAFAGRLALACDVFRHRDQHAETLTEDTTKPILVHERDRK
jgi:hypothetical protein